jgi:hypothetical protein
MEMADTAWKITTGELPGWIMQSETVFHEIIEEEFKSV